MQSLWPFSIWKFDMICQISPISSRGHKFIIIATKYFTKYVKAIPLILRKGLKIAEFIKHHIIFHFRIFSQIIIDNRNNFKNKEVLALCKGYHIRISFSTPYYPQRNEQVDATNKIICSILLKIIDNSHRD